MTGGTEISYTLSVAIALYPSFELDRDNRVQLQMEADVRRMLRRADDPLRLAGLPLAQRLCAATGISSPQEALGHVIEAAFKGIWPETRLRDLLLTADLDGRVSRTDTAQRLRVSMRHLQRRRARAVAVLASHICKLVVTPGADPPEKEHGAAVDPLEALAELVSELEPAVAAAILRLNGARLGERAAMLTMRASVEAGNDVEAQGQQVAFSPLVATLRAQSKTINAKEAEAERELLPIFASAARDLTQNSEIRFELEWLAFLRARYRGCVRQIELVATNLSRIARNSPPWKARAMLAQAEARLRCGRIQDAVALLDQAERLSVAAFALRQLASSSLLRGEIALHRGEDADAERLATGANAILRTRHCDAYRSQVTLARAALRLGKRWTCTEDLTNLAPAAWDRVSLDIETARHLSAAGSADRARQAAHESYATALTFRYEGLAARAAATIGRTFGRSSFERRDWHLRALSHLLATRDRSIGCDLFAQEEEAAGEGFAAFEEGVAGVLYDAVQRAIPLLRTLSKAERATAIGFLHRLTAYVAGREDFSERLSRAIEVAAVRSGCFARYVAYFSDDANDVLETAYGAVAFAQKRLEAHQRLAYAMRCFVTAVPPRDDTKRFYVG
ncbi:MAG: hypothetical protein WCB01_08945 [Candidatus Cybelea sp.]